MRVGTDLNNTPMTIASPTTRWFHNDTSLFSTIVVGWTIWIYKDIRFQYI